MQRTLIHSKKPSSANRMWKRRDTAMVEFALVIPVIMLILVGLLEFGWMTKNRLQFANAVREGARDAAIGKSNTTVKTRIAERCSGIAGASTNPADGKPAITIMRDDNNDANGYAYTITVGDKTADSSGVVYNDAPSGAAIQVTASMPQASLTGIPFSTGRTLQVSVVMRREPGS